MSDNSLKELYELFDQLVDLPRPERNQKLQQLRVDQHPLYEQLTGLLDDAASDKSSDAIINLFGNEQTLQKWLNPGKQDECTTSVAGELRELISRFRWDRQSRQFMVGCYRIGKCLSFNSYSATYFAQDQALDRNVVLTLAYPRYTAKPQDRVTFLSSTKIICEVFHPNVAAILGVLDEPDSGGEAGLLGVIRQWIPGEDLAAWLAARPTMPPTIIAQIAQRITEGLSAIHAVDALHGDLKPANIVMRQGSLFPIITDFGTVFSSPQRSLAQSKWRGGTPGYIAPELLLQKEFDSRIDLYSLGKILQDLLEHSSPLEHDTEEYQQLQSLSAQLIAAEPDNRPRDCVEVIERLMAISKLQVLDAATRQLDLGSHTDQTKTVWSRRLLLSATASILPFITARQWHQWNLTTSEPALPFVPGTDADFQSQLRVRGDSLGSNLWRRSDLRFLNLRTLEIAPNLELYSSFIAPPPKARDYEFFVETVRLPDHKVTTCYYLHQVFFDALPGKASCEVYVRNESLPKQWHLLSRRSNYFGGPIFRGSEGTVEPQLLIPGTELQFRIRISTEQVWEGTGRPPVAIKVDRVEDGYAVLGALNLWTLGT